jgi:hypothetical protein
MSDIGRIGARHLCQMPQTIQFAKKAQAARAGSRQSVIIVSS